MKFLMLAALLAAPMNARAADERARRDLNGFPTQTAVSETTGEIRRLKSTNDGFLLLKSTGAASSSIVDQGAAGSQDWLVVTNDSGNDTPIVSTHSVAGTAVEVMATDTSRESSLVCNEGPEVARLGSSATLTSSVGQRLLVDQCVTLDGPAKPYRGALSAISTTGNPTKITASEGI